MNEQPGIPNAKAPSQPPGPATKGSWLKKTLAVLGIGAGVYLVAILGLAFYWCNQPPSFELAEIIPETAIGANGQPVSGAALVSTTIKIGETLLDKPGGFLHNDVAPPGVFLDNCPNWECGAVMALRDSVRALRNDFSRSQSQSFEHPDIKRADLQFAIDPKSWLLPAAEDEYRKGIEALRGYRETLMSQPAGGGYFFARADNLASYLDIVIKRLGHQGRRLSASAMDQSLASRFAEVSADDRQNPSAPADADRTPWHEVDDAFYCARGYAWSMQHIMRAIEADFGDVLATKNATALVEQVIRDLEGATKGMSSPIVLNGDGYGILANHSLTIASYIARVNASLMDLKRLLQEG